MGETKDPGDAEIIIFQKRSDFPPIDVQRRHHECRHRQIYANAETRQTTCRDCKAVIDPFDALMIVSSRWSGICAEERSLRAEIDTLNERVEEAKKTNGKARRARDSRARVLKVDVEQVRESDLEPARIGKWLIDALSDNPVLIIETSDGKLLKRRS